MEKNHKKDLEQLLIKQIEKIFLDIDVAATHSFSKYIKSHSKDLTKKFLKAQKKLKKQEEEIISKVTSVPKKVIPAPVVKSKMAVKKVVHKNATSVAKSETSVKLAPKRGRKGNNLINAAAIQRKAKAVLVKNINKSAQK